MAFRRMMAVVIFLLSIAAILNAQRTELLGSSPRSVMGEGPHWDPFTQSLYYVDIFGTQCSVLRYCPWEDRVYCATIDGEPVVSFIIPVEGRWGQFVVGIGSRVGVIQWDGVSPEAYLIDVILQVDYSPEYSEVRFNDAKADSYGRLFAGTMRLLECDDLDIPTFGNLYRLFAGEPIVALMPPDAIRLSNGITGSFTNETVYYIDSCNFGIISYDYDPCTGDLSNPYIVFNLTYYGYPSDVLLDGMTIDADGNLFVAVFGAGEVIQINPQMGTIEMVIEFPADQVTSVAWGGENLDELYVTTAAQPKTGPQSAEAGHLFRVGGLGVKGTPVFKARVY